MKIHLAICYLLIPTSTVQETQVNKMFTMTFISLNLLFKCNTQLSCTVASVPHSRNVWLSKNTSIFEIITKVFPPPPFVRIHDSPSYNAAGAEEKCVSIKSGMSLLGSWDSRQTFIFAKVLSGENHQHILFPRYQLTLITDHNFSKTAIRVRLQLRKHEIRHFLLIKCQIQVKKKCTSLFY